MTASIATRRTVADVGAAPAFRPVVAITLAVAAVSMVWSPPSWFAAATAIAIVLALGIPHGALDHLAIEAVDGRSQGSRVRFVSRYVLAMVGAGLVWLASPAVGLATFLAASVHHFGQSDLAHLRLGGRRQLAIQWSRGLLLVGLPLVAHVTVVAPVVEDLSGADPTGWTWLTDRWWLWCALLIGQHVAVGCVLRKAVDRSVLRRELFAVASLSVLLVAADPLIGFAVYFGLWHSIGHLAVLARVLGVEQTPVRSMIRLAAPFTAIAPSTCTLAGWTALWLVGRTDLLIPFMFVVVAMLTVPHLVVVERIWRPAVGWTSRRTDLA